MELSGIGIDKMELTPCLGGTILSLPILNVTELRADQLS